MRFDPTINLGHVLTFCGFIATGFGAYSTLDKRITVQEERSIVQASTDRRQDNDLTDLKRDTREDLKEINSKLDKILLAAQQQLNRR